MSKKVKVRYPSNIALVKYWGKHGNQLPCNPSISLTLNNAYTELELELSEKKSQELEFEYFFEGIQNEQFSARVIKYLQAQPEFTDLLKNNAIRVDSHNSFPHSTGIASSASAFASIAAAFLKASGQYKDEADFLQKASNLARLGSGSACRSFYGSYAMWGELEGVEDSNDLYAIPVTDIHENFQNMRDAILIVEDTPKKVSSSVGHGLMKDHPFAEARFVQAKQHLTEMLSILKTGDFEGFIRIVEREALSLHAMMMTSVDYYLLMEPNTVYVMQQIMDFRETTKLPICFTLDAGPNIHLLYPSNIEKQTKDFINNNLISRLKEVIYDQNGSGGIFID